MDLKIRVLRREFRLLQRVEPRVSARLLSLIELAKGRPTVRVSHDAQISERTLRSWKSAYQKAGLAGCRARHGGG